MVIPAPQSFDWMLIRSFLAVLDHGSLSAAARVLGVHQPTLGRHVEQLERQMGAALFERTGRGLAPTRVALAMVEPARQMQDGARSLARSLAHSRDQRQGSVRISASQVVASWLLPPLIARLREEEPGISVELVATNSASNLLRREADIAIRMFAPQQASLIARKVGDIAIRAYAHQRYLQRCGTPKRLQDALSAPHTVIGFDSDRTLIDGMARIGITVSREHFAIRTDDHVAYGRLVAAGCGIGFMADYVAAQMDGVQAILPRLGAPTLPCWLAVHREIRSNAVFRRVFDLLHAWLGLTLERGRSLQHSRTA